MNKIAIATAIGIAAGLALVGAYRFAPYAGFHPTPALVMVVVAVRARITVAAKMNWPCGVRRHV